MGYKLHITRSPDWTDSHRDPIERSRWNDLARDSDLLTPAGSATYGSDTEETFQLTDGGPVLHWYEGRIDVSGARDGDVDALVRLAEQLDAILVGDDDEGYPLDAGGSHAGESAAAPRAPSPMLSYPDAQLRKIRRRYTGHLIPDGRGGMKKAGWWWKLRFRTIGIRTPLGRMREH